MKNQKEIFEALSAGKTLVHLSGEEVFFNEDGQLNKDVLFSNAEAWSVKKVKVKKSKSVWVNIYKAGQIVGNYHSKEYADQLASKDRLCCKELIIEWEEEE
jgi:hypothetical protein